MTIKEYFKLTQKSSSSLIKIIGVIYTSMFALILIATNYNKSLTDVFNNFIIIFLVANGFALLIWSQTFFVSYFDVKRMIGFYESFQRQKVDMILTLHEEKGRKSDLLKLFAIGIYSNQIFRFVLDKNYVFITLYLNVNSIERFPKRATTIRRKYTKLNMDLTGYGLMRQVKYKNWKSFTSDDIILLFEELETISINENIPIIEYVQET
ncbi:MAG: hypothetical protein JZU53_06500 [Paludibacter sp.]|nr:hypothetical protein [Paludibacter sp.]